MDSVLHVAAGSAFFAVLNLALLGGAGRAAGAIPGLAPLDRLLATLSIATMQIVVILTGLGALGWMAPVPVGAASLLLSAGLSLAPGRRGSLSWTRGLLSSARAALNATPHLYWIGAPGVAIAVLAFTYAAQRPPLGFDAMTYHLALAANMMRTGDLSLFYFPHFFDLYAYMPANGDLFSVWAMLPFGCDFLLPWVNVPFVAMLVLAVHRTARDLGTGHAAALAMSSALATMPVFLTTLTESYVDLPLFATYAAALRFALAAPGRTPLLALSAGLCGVVVGTKSTGLMMAGLVFVLHAMLVLPPGRPWRPAVAAIARHAGWMAAGVLLLGAAFYVRNLVVAGNPFYPVPVDLPGLPPFPGQDRLRQALAHTTLAAYPDHLFRTGLWLKALLGETYTPYSAWGLGPIGLAALVGGPVALILTRLPGTCAKDPARCRAIFAMLAIGALAVAAYFVTPYSGKFVMFNVRFLVPAVVPLVLASSAALAAAGIQDGRLATVFLALQAGGFFYANLPVRSRSGVALVAMALIVPMLPVIARRLAVHTRGPRPPWRRALTPVAVVALVLAGLTGLHDLRDRGRHDAWRQADEPFRLVVRHMADCWSALDRALPAGRLAVAAEDSRNAFLSPLFGSHLTRDVFYVNVMEPDLRASHLWPEGRIRTRPDRDAWLRNLDRMAPDALFVFRDAEDDVPIESRWVRELPGRFEPIRVDEACAVYRVLPP